MSLDDRPQHGIGRETRLSHDDIAIDAHHVRDPLDDVDQAFPIRQVRTQQQVIRTTGAELEHAGITVEHDGPPIHAALHGLHSGNRTLRQVA
jgi:hypothetical protein